MASLGLAAVAGCCGLLLWFALVASLWRPGWREGWSELYSMRVLFTGLARVAELADALDLGSSVYDVRVQVPPRAQETPEAVLPGFIALDIEFGDDACHVASSFDVVLC